MKPKFNQEMLKGASIRALFSPNLRELVAYNLLYQEAVITIIKCTGKTEQEIEYERLTTRKSIWDIKSNALTHGVL